MRVSGDTFAGMVRAEMFDLLFRRPSSPSILLLAQLRDAFRLGAFFAELLGFEEFAQAAAGEEAVQTL